MEIFIETESKDTSLKLSWPLPGGENCQLASRFTAQIGRAHCNKSFVEPFLLVTSRSRNNYQFGANSSHGFLIIVLRYLFKRSCNNEIHDCSVYVVA
jgi:hypothetical protein